MPLARRTVARLRWYHAPPNRLLCTAYGATISSAGGVGILLNGGTHFVESWRSKDAGTVEWRNRFLQRVGPNAAATLVATEAVVPIPYTRPDASVTDAVQCKAQWIESTSVAHFK